MTQVVIRIALILGVIAMAASPSRTNAADLHQALNALLSEYRESYGFPGATMAYTLRDGTHGSVAVGLADRESGTPMTDNSRMLAASIGKTIWGALVLSLENDGLLLRFDLVADHLAHLAWFDRLPNAQTMTVAHLLTHSAGLPDHVHMEGIAPALIALGAAPDFAPEQAIAFVLDAEPLFAPGTGWAYSDTGYLLLGLVIEAATGQDVFDLVQERFLSPLGLAQTSPSITPDIPGLAVGYTVDANPFGLAPRTADDGGALLWNPAVEWTGGGFAATASDLARWGHALFTGTAIEAPYLDRLLDGIAVHPDAPGIFYGSGVAIYTDTDHGTVYGHGGWIPGYVSSLRHYADHSLTIAFQINTDVGIIDDSSDLVPALEAALAELLITADTSR